MEDLISIIVPIYNVEKYINKCIDSIIDQTYTNLEIILVDDGSPDNCGKICDEYAKKDKRIKVYHIINHGVSYARNYGIEKANGKWITFVDSDDYISKYMYEMLLKNAKKHKAQISICDITRNEKKFLKEEQKDNDTKEITYDLDTYMKKFFKINGQDCEYYIWNKLFDKNIIDADLLPIKYHEGEDVFAVLKAALKAEKIVYQPLNLYYYRMNTNSVTAKFSNTDYELIELWDDIVSYVSKNNDKYIEYAILNRKRINLTVLVRMGLNIPIKEVKNNPLAKNY